MKVTLPRPRLESIASTACNSSSPNYAPRITKYLQLGPLARIGPNNLITSDPEIFRHILSVRSNYQRGPWFDCLRLDPHRANLITERDIKTHNVLRAQMSAGYHGKDVDQFEAILDQNMAAWLTYVENNGVSVPGHPREFEIARSVQWLLYDMVCRLCFGHPFGFVEKHSDCYQFQQTLEERLPIVEKFAVLTEVNTWIKFISHIPVLRDVLPAPSDENGIGAILGLAEKAVKQRNGPGMQPRGDIIDSWLQRGVDPSLAVSEITIALFAGSDTTATSIRALLLHIITNPLVYAKVKQEINTAEAQGELSNPAAEAELKQLPYLQTCIKEGLRVFPPITALRERVVPDGGDTLRGVYIPAGTNIGLNLPGMLRNEVFGLDAHVFRPERWLEADEEQLQRMERVHELLFNWGSTRCLGIRLANTMIGKFFVEVFRRWDITSTHPQQPWKSRCHGIFYQTDFHVRITSGDSMRPLTP
ncbi:putative P450 monooxygenase [Paecilomyces variotii No. 5]|uniref:Putative P450 monooxygenase n=1 Tax=Byssochlamys spectabilis (strain No. 5 / NBRC 109023) TaxID=1356009 RepID=V5G8K3_BYSSN|nr:putative P450 monooxygenase [Paecilomyces variotii No. 5]